MLRCIRPTSEDQIRSKQIDKELQVQHHKFDSAIKILLLGTGESGKTTIIKQMKILHINGFTDDERLEKAKEIRQNVHESIYTLCIQVENLELDYDSKNNRKISEYIVKLGERYSINFPENYYNCAHRLWHDSGIQECYRRSNEFQLIDSAKYFLDKINEISQQSYMPSTDDILHSRKITTGIHEIVFNVKVPKNMGGGNQEFRMFDVGGQRDQRNKWLQAFEGIQAVLFIISCADFDQTLREDQTENRLTEAINLFSLIWHNRFLVNTGLIVFLNKQDIMEQKIKQGKTIGNWFPDYENFRATAKDGNVFDESVRTRCFIRQKLIDITKEPPRRLSSLTARECYYHFTIATDTNNIRTVFNDVHHMIVISNLKRVGMF